MKASKRGSEAEKCGEIMQGGVFQQGIFMRQLHEMSPSGLFRGECAPWFSLQKGRMGKEIYLPDPSHFPSSIALKFAFQGFNSSLLPGCITQPLQQLHGKPDLMPSAWSSSKSRSAMRHKCFPACCCSTSGSLTGSAESDSYRAEVEQVIRGFRVGEAKRIEVEHKVCLIYTSTWSPPPLEGKRFGLNELMYQLGFIKLKKQTAQVELAKARRKKIKVIGSHT